MIMSKNKNALLSLVITSVCYSGNLLAAEACTGSTDTCGHTTGFYIGGEFGTSNSNFDKDLAKSLASGVGLDVTSAKVEDDDHSAGIIFGYQFNDFFAIEGGYRNLGEYYVDLTGETTDPAEFSELASSIYPESGDGKSLGVVLSYPFNDAWKLSAKLGVWDWEGDNEVSSTTVVGSGSNDGTDPYYGLEASYQVTSNLQAYASAVRYEFERDESTNLSLGLRYFFGTENKKYTKPAPAAAKPKEPARVADVQEPVKGAKPKDTDGDGVFDHEDKCAGTPSNHVVDAKGCTVYEKVDYQHQLVIYYPNNSSVIDSAYQAKIQELVDFAKDKGIKYMQVVGHTSAPGKEDYNQWLSERRAESLQKVLVEQHGYSASQIETVGKGESDPAVAGNTEAAYSKNRRIEVNLSATGKNPKTK